MHVNKTSMNPLVHHFYPPQAMAAPPQARAAPPQTFQLTCRTPYMRQRLDIISKPQRTMLSTSTQLLSACTATELQNNFMHLVTLSPKVTTISCMAMQNSGKTELSSGSSGCSGATMYYIATTSSKPYKLYATCTTSAMHWS
jgi:hypothetical protein